MGPTSKGRDEMGPTSMGDGRERREERERAERGREREGNSTQSNCQAE